MAKSNNDEKKFRTENDSSEKENYDRLLSVFHIGTDVKRFLLDQYLREKHLNVLDWLTDLNQTFLKFDDVKRAIKRSSTIDLKDLELSTIDILLKFNCFDLFWDVCLLNTRLEEILNRHKEELLGIYQTSMTPYDLSSSSTKQNTPSLTKIQWEILFKSRECSGIRKEGNVADISATKNITLSSLDETLNVLLLHTVCPLYKSVNIVSECQIQILKIAVINSECEGFTFENLWNRIESHIISIASHCKLSDYFKRKCKTTKQTVFNRNFSQDNRKCILEDAFNHPDFIRQNQFCNRVRKELDLIHLDDNLNLARKLCGKGIPILLVDGKYTNGTYSLSVVESADKDLQVVKSVCSHQVMKADQNETEDDMQTDDIQKRINMHSHLKVVQLITNIAKDVLVDVLKGRLPCANFGYAFNGMKNRILPQLNIHGRQLLYPDGSSYSGDLSDLDISLIYTILRNIHTIAPQLNGWGNMPKDTDRSLSANIDRIRIFKNNYVSHCSNLSLDEQDFLQTWKEISKCIIELGGDDYIEKIDSILTTEINYVMEKELCNTIRRLKEPDRQNELNYNSLKEDLNEIKQHLSMTTKPPTVIATASNGFLGSVPLELRIEGESIPLVEEIKKRTDNLSSDDMQITFAKEGSVIIGLKVSPSALYTVGNFLGIIDTLLSKLLKMNEHYGNGYTTRIVVYVNFMDEQNEPIGFGIKQKYGVVSTNQLYEEIRKVEKDDPIEKIRMPGEEMSRREVNVDKVLESFRKFNECVSKEIEEKIRQMGEVKVVEFLERFRRVSKEMEEQIRQMIVMSREKQNVSSKNPQQKGLLKVSKGPKEEIQIFSDKEFKGLLMSGAYRCFWNRIFLTGPFGVGKTSLAKILVGDEAPEERQSTDGILIYLGRAGMDIKERCWIFLKHGTILNATVQSLLRSKEVTATVGAVKSVDDKENLDTVKQSEETKNQDVVTSIPDAGEVTHSGNMSKPGALKSQDNIPHAVKKKSKLKAFLDLPNRLQKAFKGRTPSHIVAQNDRGGKMAETKIEENLTGIDMSEEEIIKLVRSQCTLGQYEMVIVPIDLWDIGGKKIYYLTQQLFVTSRGTFLLIFNGSRDIHEDIPEYTELPGCQGQRNTAVYLIHWVNSVLTYCKTVVENKEYPKILCVATHKDLVKGDVEEQRTSLENSIEELFQNHGGKKHLQYKPLIFVNARNKDDEEITTLKKVLVDVALDHPRCGELMPTKFVPLELQLARKVDKNKKILTMDELNDINKQNKKMALTPAQLKSFLKVNHALGKLIYFDEAGLKDNVIIDPVFLVDVLRSIVTDDQFWPDHLKEILKALKESGKLLKKDLYEIWKQDCFREIWAHNDYIVDMLVHLDIICRPKDDEDGSDFFLVPCMISTKREDSQHIDLDRSIHLAYRFKEEVVPLAILYRFIATFISIWKLRVSAKSSRLMIFTDSADVRIDGDHDMRFDIKGNRVIVSLIHKDNKSTIIPTIASTAQECLTYAITNISNFYFSVSGDSACNRDMPFTIQIGIPCGTDLCFFDHTLSSKEWVCPEHKTKHKTNDVSIWFADKLHTKDDRCTEDCPGLDKVWLDRQPEDKHLGRLAAKLTNEDTRKIYIRLQEVEPALQWNIINESSKRGGFDIKINALYDWKKSSVFASFKQLQQSLIYEDIDIHKLCQISREVKKEFNQPKEKLQLRPSIPNTQKLPDHIGNQTFQLGIELGLSVDEMQQIESNHVTNLRSQTEEVLNKWRRLPEATYEVLEKALHRLQLSSVLSYLTYDEGLEEQLEIGLDEGVEVELEEAVGVGLEKELAERIIQDIQISQVLDYMMSHLVISSDDRRRIEHLAGKDEQNEALLGVVNKRGEPTYSVFVDALRTSGYTDLSNELECDSQKEGSSSALVYTRDTSNKGLSNWTIPIFRIRLQKNYSNIINSILHGKIVDHLISRDVLSTTDSERIDACPTKIEQIRKLMDILLHGSENGFIEFLNALREDSEYTELADEIESTTVSSRDISTMQSCFK